MKHCIRLIACLLLLLLALPLSAVAEEDAAADLTARCTFEARGYDSARSRIMNSQMERYQAFEPGDSFSLSWDGDVPATRLCLQWRVLPENVTIIQYGADGMPVRREQARSLPETITELLPETRRVKITAGKSGMQVFYCRVFGDGTLPEPFHEWNETPDKLDYLLISTHPDDDVLYLGSIVPVYGAEQGYVGTIAYVTCQKRVRMTEAENGAWTMGLRNRPLFLGFPDVPRNAPKEQMDTFVYEEVLLATVRLYRQYRPNVVVAQDKKGEYGHWQHKLTSKASVEAAPLAADPTYDPESAEQYGTWQVQKVFLHLYEENHITVDAHKPLSFFGGDDAYNVARKAYRKHESQQKFGFSVCRDDGEYAFNQFGMAYGVVEVGEDIFDNIDETLFASYVPPTPEPTAEPTPEPTEAPTATPEPTKEPTPKPTAIPSPEPTPAPEKTENRTAQWIIFGMLFMVCAAVIGGSARKKSGEAETEQKES